MVLTKIRTHFILSYIKIEINGLMGVFLPVIDAAHGFAAWRQVQHAPISAKKIMASCWFNLLYKWQDNFQTQ